MVIENGRIIAAGPEVRPPGGARTIDARGKYLLPGLWDMHSHLAAQSAIGRKPESYVGHGVLGVRDMGGHIDQLLALRAELAGGRIGPELVMAGPTLNGRAFADFHRVVATADEALAAVRGLRTRGVDLIKVHRALSPDVFPALLDEAQRAGLPVAGHVPLGMSWIAASEAGMHSIEHAQTIVENVVADRANPAPDIPAAVARLQGAEGDAILAMLSRRRTCFDPTLIAYEHSIGNVEPQLAARRRQLLEWLKQLVGRANAAGVPILAGSDMLDRAGPALLDEVERLVESGLTAIQALKAATSTAARAAGKPQAGRIAEGAPASLLLLDADPSADVRNLRQLGAVVLRGRLIEASELARLRALDDQAGAGETDAD